MRYLFKISIINAIKASTNRLSTAFSGVKLGKTSNPCNDESEMGSFSRLKGDDGTRAVLTTEAIGTNDGSNELESGVPMNIIRIQDCIEQIRTQRIQ